MPDGSIDGFSSEYEAALGRIEQRDVLDGHILPPDNNEPFNPGTLRGIQANGTTVESQPIQTNSEARRVNVELIARGLGPLFAIEIDPVQTRKNEDIQRRAQHNKNRIASRRLYEQVKNRRIKSRLN